MPAMPAVPAMSTTTAATESPPEKPKKVVSFAEEVSRGQRAPASTAVTALPPSREQALLAQQILNLRHAVADLQEHVRSPASFSGSPSSPSPQVDSASITASLTASLASFRDSLTGELAAMVSQEVSQKMEELSARMEASKEGQAGREGQVAPGHPASAEAARSRELAIQNAAENANQLPFHQDIFKTEVVAEFRRVLDAELIKASAETLSSAKQHARADCEALGADLAIVRDRLHSLDEEMHRRDQELSERFMTRQDLDRSQLRADTLEAEQKAQAKALSDARDTLDALQVSMGYCQSTLTQFCQEDNGQPCSLAEAVRLALAEPVRKLDESLSERFDARLQAKEASEAELSSYLDGRLGEQLEQRLDAILPERVSRQVSAEVSSALASEASLARLHEALSPQLREELSGPLLEQLLAAVREDIQQRIREASSQAEARSAEMERSLAASLSHELSAKAEQAGAQRWADCSAEIGSLGERLRVLEAAAVSATDSTPAENAESAGNAGGAEGAESANDAEAAAVSAASAASAVSAASAGADVTALAAAVQDFDGRLLELEQSVASIRNDIQRAGAASASPPAAMTAAAPASPMTSAVPEPPQAPDVSGEPSTSAELAELQSKVAGLEEALAAAAAAAERESLHVKEQEVMISALLERIERLEGLENARSEREASGDGLKADLVAPASSEAAGVMGAVSADADAATASEGPQEPRSIQEPAQRPQLAEQPANASPAPAGDSAAPGSPSAAPPTSTPLLRSVVAPRDFDFDAWKSLSHVSRAIFDSENDSALTFNSLFIDPETNAVAASDGAFIRVWSVDPLTPEEFEAARSGEAVYDASVVKELVECQGVTACAIGGDMIYAGNDQGYLGAWPAVGDIYQHQAYPGDSVAALTVLRDLDRSYVVSGSGQGAVGLWAPLQNNFAILGEHASYVTCVDAFGGQALTGGADCASIVWDLDRGVEARRLLGHSDAVLSSYICRENQNICVTGGADGRVYLWDLRRPRAEGKYIFNCVGPAGAQRPSGGITGTYINREMLVTASQDGYVTLWDLRSERPQTAQSIRVEGGVINACGVNGNMLILTSEPGALLCFEFGGRRY